MHATRYTNLLVLLASLAAGCTTGTAMLDGGREPQPDSGPAETDARVPPSDAGPEPECTPEGMGSTIGAECASSVECDDHCFCNGLEVCVDGTCQAGSAPCTASECATPVCDEAERSCSAAGDDSLCDDGEPCNGAERCDVRSGCRPGAPPTCNDADLCTIDYCEPGVGCVYDPYDGDGDGASSRSCGGDDCDDRDPAIGTHAGEACENGIDDDCNGSIDIEDPSCTLTNDTCATAEDITPSGLGTFRFRRSTRGFASDTTLACTSTSTDTRRTGPDAVFVLRLAETQDLELRVEGLGYNAGLILREQSACESGPDLKCIAPSSSTVEPVLHRRRLPAGDYVVVVKTRTETAFTLAVTLSPPSASQTDVCTDDMVDITAGGTFTGALEDHDYLLSCRSGTSAYPEAALRLVVPAGEFRDVQLSATTRTPTGSSSTAWLQLTSACGVSDPAYSECASGTTSAPATLGLRGVPEGTYYVLLESSSTAAGVGSYSLDAVITPSAGRTPGDACTAGVPVELTGGAPREVDLSMLDPSRDAGPFCGANRAGYRDAFFTFELAAERDVTVRTTSTARHWAGLSSACGVVEADSACMASSSGAIDRTFVRVPAGRHYLNVSTLADAGTLAAEIITAAPTPRPGNDLCAGAAPVADGTPLDVDLRPYSDDGDLACGGTDALDAYYTFTLLTDRFVTLRAEGASSMAVLSSGCGSTPAFCITGAPPQLTQTLTAGTYHVVVESPALDPSTVRLRFTTSDP